MHEPKVSKLTVAYNKTAVAYNETAVGYNACITPTKYNTNVSEVYTSYARAGRASEAYD
jgi:hypothetical protein